ncbi:MAG: Asp/Glu-specific dipeptidyl-peptidase [Melioribacteraceae bacterium]|nr:MAG: Asp/Glu-specific dipeptidyl-peptidase [Melioribacteraceae bacterium]
MYPLSEISNLDLTEAGLKIDPKEVYNPDGVSLIDALVKVGGCTGSFVSPDGLIITNHHCAFGSLNRASTTENNYLENGLLAETKEDEIPATGVVCRITESYEDVSEEVLNAADEAETLADRTKLIAEKIREIEARESDLDNSIEAGVSEMFVGKTYILFRYRMIKDVRLVYAPPKSIGNFGGETDNWVWPRHTGDFTFMRAYVAPDGSAAEYSEENVPFNPKKYLKVNPNGVDEGDFLFILGYPARTFRHQPANFLKYQNEYQLPYIQKIYSWMIHALEEIAGDDEALQLEFASTIKSFANVEKNYRGKMLGIRRLELVDKKYEEEKQLAEFIKSKPELAENYSGLFDEINSVYEQKFANAEADLWFGQLFRRSKIMYSARFIVNYAEQLQKDDSERTRSYKEEKLSETITRVSATADDFNPEFEKRLLVKMFCDALKFEGSSKIPAVESKFGGSESKDEIEKFVENLVNMVTAGEENPIMSMVANDPEEIMNSDLEIIKLVMELKEQDDKIEEQLDEFDGAMNTLLADLVEVKRLWNEAAFVPDANRTLRLTYGFVKGYAPADAINYSPITTLDGVIDKALTGNPDYEIPAKLRELYEAKDFGRFYDDKLGGIPTGILYNTDTSGGNSGSPIMDANGNLVGVNFDRAFEATINDFAWDDAYSRSIGVDIRYVLWVTQKIGGAGFLLEEMGVSLK